MKVLLFLVLISGLGLGDAIFYSKPMKILDIEIPKSLIYILICHLVLVLTCWVVYTKMSMGRWTLIKIMWMASFIASLVTIPRWSSFALNSRNVIWFTWPNWLKMAIFLKKRVLHIHCWFLEPWNREKSLSLIWQHFSCLLDEWIAKISKKIFFHGGFLR